MRKKLILLAALAFFVSEGQVQAQFQDEGNPNFNKGGRTAFQFVKIGVGARQVGMAEAAIASVYDINSVFWNPAGIAGIQNAELTMSYNRWLADMNYLAAAAGVRWNGVGVFAFHVASLDFGDIPEALVQDVGGPGDARTGNTFTGGDMMLGLSFSREFTDRLAIGFTARFMREDLFEYAVNNYSFDVGTYYDTGYNGIRIAMSAQNYSPWTVRWLDATDREQGYDVPLMFRVGVSMGVVGNQQTGFFDAGPGHEVRLNADAINTNDYGERLHVGTEYVFNNLLALRGGYRFNYEEGNLALGFGLNTNSSSLRLSIDYAYVNYEFLSNPHRLTLTVGL